MVVIDGLQSSSQSHHRIDPAFRLAFECVTSHLVNKSQMPCGDLNNLTFVVMRGVGGQGQVDYIPVSKGHWRARLTCAGVFR